MSRERRERATAPVERAAPAELGALRNQLLAIKSKQKDLERDHRDFKLAVLRIVNSALWAGADNTNVHISDPSVHLSALHRIREMLS